MNSSAFMENLRQLFAECDTDNNGSLGRDEFGDLCIKIGLNREAANETFDRLDIDRNDRITFDEFAAGFNQYSKQSSNSPHSPQVSAGARGQHKLEPPSPADTGLQVTSSMTTTTAGPAATGSRTSSVGRGSAKLSPISPVTARTGRKSASPLGVLSLGSTGSSSNLQTGRSTTDASGSGDYNSVDIFSTVNTPDIHQHHQHHSNASRADADSVVVYSSDAIPDYDQAGGGNSGQFGSLMSSNGSFSQLRNMQDLLDCVQKLQSENQILSQIFFKDKREREEYISQLGEEFDLQVREVEERANRRAKEELENEKKRLSDMMQAERETLQHHYQTIEKMSKLIKSPQRSVGLDNDELGIDRVRSQLEDTYLENRQLKRSLLDTKTDVAMIWKEMEKLKKQYEDKLSSAYERNNETRNECDHIKQQLNLMKDSNRKLQDASDVITTYITDKVEPVIKGAVNNISSNDEENSNYLLPNLSARLGPNSQSNSRRGSILSDYINGAEDGSMSIDGTNTSMNADVDSIGSDTQMISKRKISTRNQHQQERISDIGITNQSNHIANKDDSLPKPAPKFAPIPHKSENTSAETRKKEGLIKGSFVTNTSDDEECTRSSPIGSAEVEENTKMLHQNEAKRTSINKEQNSPINVAALNTSVPEKLEVSKVKLEAQKSNTHSKSTSLRNIGRHFFIGSRAPTDVKAVDIMNAKTVVSKPALDTTAKSVDSSIVDTDEPLVEPADGPSVATFNIILVGDSFVGKSSFAARFMEGSFVQGLISNCSIDFKTKTYKVEGVNYTVNLWDTAGQERFRSITASYFRKADGIILMYDVTDKRSYLNVRNWMSTISDTAAENVAVLLIGNKIDLRQKHNIETCVPTEEGSRLAREYGIVFLETSVKTGTNLVPSMGKLIIMIAKNNEPVEEDKDRIRLNDKTKIFNCMPKNC